ncbi:hypothetical protein chiPu_0014460 [Chiloscyllium punctatum]|uniref:Uncharacterized protein n=1 Tax=Chiloscyllium punctatum TaxID=137246 RepID=A0A401T005_CHIPU|nr:hypothetical protein [Chiloscyllium punctatum]
MCSCVSDMLDVAWDDAALRSMGGPSLSQRAARRLRRRSDGQAGAILSVSAVKWDGEGMSSISFRGDEALGSEAVVRFEISA